jgi:DNA-directed RNA polymerase II subunit RPB2
MSENSISKSDIFTIIKKIATDEDHSMHVACGNNFVEKIMPYIITNIFPISMEIPNTRNSTPEEKNIDFFKIRIILDNVNQEKPLKRAHRTSKLSPLFPTEAINNNLTLYGDVKVNVNIYVTIVHKDGKEVKSESKLNQITLISMPVMVGSIACNTHGLPKDVLDNIGEDITDQGGYWIIKGGKYIINFLESNVYNLERIYNNIGFMNEKTRVEIISKTGDGPENSYQTYIKLLTGGQIVVIIDRDPLKNIIFPFFILFRLLGWETDKQIYEWIVYGDKTTPISKQIISYLNKAYDAEYKEFPDSYKMSRDDILRSLCFKITENYTNKIDFSDEKTRIYYEQNKIMKSIDEYFIPHCGSTFNYRTDKAIFLALAIRKMILTNMDIIPQTDRDSFYNKRIHDSAHCLAKAFKQHINNVIRRIIQQVTKDCSTTPFHKIDIGQSVKNSIDTQGFLRTMCQAITVGTKQELKTSGNMVMINRLVSQLINPKNQAFVKALMKQVNRPGASSSRQSSRAVEMRKTHSTSIGVLDPIQTPEGESVGLSNGLCILTKITYSSSSQVLIDILKQDKDIIPLKNNSFMLMESYSLVYVNKIPVGLCKYKTRYMYDKYRDFRLHKKIHPLTSITWNPNSGDLDFWVDNGRAYRPMLKVYNNYGNSYTKKEILAKRFPEQKNPEQYVREKYPKMEDFKQWTLLTKQHMKDLLDGKITIENLVNENIMEYVTSIELESLLVSVDYNNLLENLTNPLLRYDYCDEPISLFNIFTLGIPFASYAPPGRSNLAITQSKQTCGWYSFNYYNELIKSGYFQYECQIPIATTSISDFSPPNGMNAKVAIMINTGMNVEDGVVINKDAVDLGLFRVYNFKFIIETLERGQQFGMPDPTNTKDIRPNVSYEKLVNGFPKKGTIINYDDVIIAKKNKLSSPDGNFIYSDCSKIYKNKVPGIVNKVFMGIDDDGKTFVKVQLIVVKDTKSGDKFAMRCGQKSICSVVNGIDMPYNSNGESPTFIFNPHSLPSRMTINASLELLFSKVCIERNEIGDATIFNKVDIEYLHNELKKYGLREDGTERLYDGRTGRWIDCYIYTGYIFYQRLQKFPDEQVHIVNKCSTDIVTRQPLKGKSSNGGLRLGEMEKDIILSNGMCRTLNEKFTNHSDGCKAHICCNCGNYAIVNEEKKIYKCNVCDELAVIVEIDTTWTSKMFFDYLRSMNIKTELLLEKHSFYD